MAGARFDYIPLGPFVLTRGDGTVRIRRQVRRFACDAMLPSATWPRAQLFAASIGGPAANLVLGVALIVVALGDGLGSSAYLAPLVLLLVGLFMAGHGLVNVLPWRPYGVPSDGWRVLSLLRRSHSARRWVALKTIAAHSASGTRPRDWPAQELGALVQASDGSIDDVSGALTLYWHLLDSGKLNEARDCLEQARAAASQRYMTQVNAQLVLLELAYIEARIGPDPAVAASNLLRSAFFAPATLARVVAAIQLSYANFAEAQVIAASASEDMSGLRPGAAVMERELLAALADEAERRRAGLAAADASAERTSAGVDVSRFAKPDVPLREPLPPAGVRSAKTVVGIISSAMLGLTTFVVAGAFDRAVAPLLAIVAATMSALAVMCVRFTRGAATLGLARHGLAALGMMLTALPLLIGDLLRANATGYIWIAGQARPCTNFGTGHEVSAVILYAIFMAFAVLGLLIGTRVHNEPIIPRRGIYVGVACLAIWVALFGSDHTRFAVLIGCTTQP
jgi:hypothetical protein